MDACNIHILCKMKPENSKATIELLGKYNPNGEVIIRDPIFVSIV